jgi:hypothetical protein
MSFSKDDMPSTYSAFAESVQTLLRIFTSSTNWLLPLVYSFTQELRIISCKADKGTHRTGNTSSYSFIKSVQKKLLVF